MQVIFDFIYCLKLSINKYIFFPQSVLNEIKMCNKTLTTLQYLTYE